MSELYIPKNPHEALRMRGAMRLFALGKFVFHQTGLIERLPVVAGAIADNEAAKSRKIVNHIVDEGIALTVRAEGSRVHKLLPDALECGVREDSVETMIKLDYIRLDEGSSFFGEDDDYFRRIEGFFVSHVRAGLYKLGSN